MRGRSRRGWAALTALLLAAGSLLAVPSRPADAGTFPGENGRIAVDHVETFSSGVRAVNPDGTGGAVLTSFSGIDYTLDWTSDAARVVFVNRSLEHEDELVTENADGTGRTTITNTPGLQEGGPSWSPDGARIAYHAAPGENGNVTGSSDVWIANADGSGATNFTNAPQSDQVYPAWSPDGSRIAYAGSGADGPLDIFVQGLLGGTTNLTNSPGHDAHPSWSPDGQHIVFESVRSGSSDIWTMRADGTDLRRLTTHPGSEREPTWSPDGTMVAFIGDESGGPQLYRLDVATAWADPFTAAHVQLTSGNAFRGHPSWEPAFPVASVSPGSHDFGAVTIGSPVTTTVTVENTGPNGFVTTDPPTFSGAAANEYDVLADGCVNATLESGDTCTITVEFTANDLDDRPATLTIPTNLDPLTVAFTAFGNAAPTAGPVSASGIEDGPNIPYTPLVSDPNATDALTCALVSGTTSGGFNGTIAISPDCSGGVVDPDDDLNGTFTFDYEVTDEHGLSDTATVTIVVDPVNDAPIADDAAFTTDEDVALTGQLTGSDPVEGDPLTFAAGGPTSTQGGTVVVNGNGTFEYTPPQDFFGTDTFEFTVNDGTDDSAPATVTITVLEEIHETVLKLRPALLRVTSHPGLWLLTTGGALLEADTLEPVVGETVEYRANGQVICSAVTDEDGWAACSGGVTGALNVLLHFGYRGFYDGGPDHLPTSATGTMIQVLKLKFF